MVHLTVGMGEVGSAINKIVGGMYITHKKTTWGYSKVDVVHICIPYSKVFDKEVRLYKQFAPLVIVHSSVPVGTCDALGVVHSPVRGIHPRLEEGIRIFTKYFGGKNARKAANIFKDLGLTVKVYKEARTTEALKLWDTTYYGRVIMFEKEVYAWCEKNNIDFKAVYIEANNTYNEGYTELGMEHVVRPVLKHMSGPIGGHCVNENAKLLKVKL